MVFMDFKPYFSLTIFLSVIANLFVLVTVFSTIFLYRDGVFSFFFSEHIEEEKRELVLEKIFIEAEEYEERIIETVAFANPAVVSVIGELATSVPQERNYFERFLDMEGRSTSGGSGFLVSSDGHIVTNRHVVENDNLEYFVLMNNGNRYGVDVLDMDPFFDVAILKIDSDEVFNYLEFGDSNELQVGQTAIAIGNALGEFQNSVSVGVISGLSRSITAGGSGGRMEFFDEVIQTDAAINPGNSGGPLMDSRGFVIGVNSALALSSQNIGFAVPSNIIKPIVDSVKESGRIIRPFLGVRYVEVTPFVMQQEGISVDYGILLVSGSGPELPAVTPNSPAEMAGLKEGDIIVEMNGERLDERRVFARKIRQKRVGDTIELRVVRGEEDFKIEVELVEAPDNL